VELLRDRNKAPIALVAVSSNKVVGHIMFSPVTVTLAPKNFRGVGLAPLCVLPEFQRQGIGSMLAREGLKQCTKAGFDMAVVLGSRHYYPRFGFSRASDYGLGNEYNGDENFMALELKDGVFDKVGGTVQYSPEFKETGC
jgi:putative acetyltransferase